MTPPQTIAIFSGSFDPPTIAHSTIISACLELPEFDQIWVMPTGSREDKNIVASPEERLAMLQLMKEKEFNNSAMLIVSDFELKLPQPTQTIRTVEALTQKFPDYKFWFVYGGDSYQSLPSWESGDYLRDSLPVLLVNRYGFDLPKESEHIRYIALNSDKNLADVSSTLVRQSLQTGSSYSTLINDSTRAFIRDRMLYWASKKA